MNVGQIIIPAMISLATNVLTALFVKYFIERKLIQAKTDAETARQGRVKYTELRGAWMWTASRVIYNLVRIAQGRKQANGDLESAYVAFEKADCEIKELDRQRSAEMQED